MPLSVRRRLAEPEEVNTSCKREIAACAVLVGVALVQIYRELWSKTTWIYLALVVRAEDHITIVSMEIRSIGCSGVGSGWS